MHEFHISSHHANSTNKKFIFSRYIYIYSQNYDNITMYYYVHFTALLDVSYCLYFHYMYPMYITWLRIIGVLLLWLSQSLLTDTDSRCANYRCKQVQWDRGTPCGSEGRTNCFLWSEDAGPVEHSVYTVWKYTVYISVHGYWALYYDCIIKLCYIYKNGLNVVK